MHCWQIDFSLILDIPTKGETEDFLNDAGMRLVEAGAAGAHWETPAMLTAFFYADSKNEAELFAQSYSESVHDNPIRSFTVSEVPEKNWTLCSAELLQPLCVGGLTVSPISDISALPAGNRKNGEIFIIPGMGFGTGHHPTTKTILALLQHDIVRDQSAADSVSLLDFGTGSGLLAIAAQTLYPHITISGVDNDAAAVDNAKENASLNDATDIVFSVGDSIKTECDILLANIYAEALITFQTAMYDHLSASGVLILSGIMKEKLPLIDQAFTADRWNKVEQIVDQGWASILYKKE